MLYLKQGHPCHNRLFPPMLLFMPSPQCLASPATSSALSDKVSCRDNLRRPVIELQLCVLCRARERDDVHTGLQCRGASGFKLQGREKFHDNQE
ncbi:hypothetical protein ACQJBY_035730 [Aegilops geniculata]